MIVVSACLAGKQCKYSGGHNLIDKIKNLVDEGKAVIVCPEELGGLPTPRNPAEIVGGSGLKVLSGEAKIIDNTGRDVTEQFLLGAHRTLELIREVGSKEAILKESSPSCGSTTIYDGTFRGKKVPGEGVTVALLRQNGISVVSELQSIQEDDPKLQLK